MELHENHRKILKLCADDETGLWLVIKRICGEEYYWSIVTDSLRQEVMNTIHDLLSYGFIEAGNFEKEEAGKYKWMPLLLSADKIIKFIEHEWNSLGKTPNIADICWFIATEKGKNLQKNSSIKTFTFKWITL